MTAYLIIIISSLMEPRQARTMKKLLESLTSMRLPTTAPSHQLHRCLSTGIVVQYILIVKSLTDFYLASYIYGDYILNHDSTK